MHLSGSEGVAQSLGGQTVFSDKSEEPFLDMFVESVVVKRDKVFLVCICRPSGRPRTPVVVHNF